MKKIKLLVTFIALGSILSVVFAQPDGITYNYTGDADVSTWTASAVYNVIKVETPPTIDGDPTDEQWELVPWQKFQSYTDKTAAWSGDADCSVWVKFLWDDETIYGLFRIIDDTIKHWDNHNGYYFNQAFNGIEPEADTIYMPEGVKKNGSVKYWQIDGLTMEFTTNEIPSDTIWHAQTRKEDRVTTWYRLYPGAEDDPLRLMRDINWDHLTTDSTLRAMNYPTCRKQIGGDLAIYMEYKDIPWGEILPGSTILTGTPSVGDTMAVGIVYADEDGDDIIADHEITLRCAANHIDVERETYMKLALIEEPTYSVTFNVKDSQSNPVDGATVMFNETSQTTDASGITVFSELKPMENVTYMVTKENFENGIGSVTVVDSDVSVDVTLTSTSTGLGASGAGSFRIYPNPARDQLMIEHAGGILHIEVYNLTGQLLRSIQDDTGTSATIDISELNKGIYFLNISSEKGMNNVVKFSKM